MAWSESARQSSLATRRASKGQGMRGLVEGSGASRQMKAKMKGAVKALERMKKGRGR